MKSTTYNNYLNNLSDILKKNSFGNLLKEGLFGIEKENVRVDTDGKLSMTPHNVLLGNKETNPYITTDFSDSQVEMITPPLPSINEVHGFIETIHDIITDSIGNELLWPQSTPPILPDENEIPIAKYGKEKIKNEIYREDLAKKYGKKRQMISGLHFNYSITDRFITQLQSKHFNDVTKQQLTNDLYLRITRNFMRYRWFIVWLFGQSPTSHDTLVVKSLQTGEDKKLQCNKGVSTRTSPHGYRNKKDYYIDYTSLETFKQSIKDLVDAGELQFDKELYLPIRIKFDQQEEISHLEVRILDLDPYEKSGVSKVTLHFLHIFLMYCLLKDENSAFSEEEQLTSTKNQDLISCFGMDANTKLMANSPITPDQWSAHIMNDIEATLNQLNIISDSEYAQAMNIAYNISKEHNKSRVFRLKKEIEEQGFINFHLNKALIYKNESTQKAYRFHGFEDMELSTQLLMKAAIRRGITINILDRKENFISLQKGDKKEYIMQATRTSLDPYNSVLMMENKVVTKKVLKEFNINVPDGNEYDNADIAKSDYIFFRNRPIVVKPKSTNFGIGITILKENDSKELYERAVEMAFENEDSILIEEFIPGKEFRIFVINNKVVGILHRVPANVCGDGKSTIEQLIDIKNNDPIRGKGYKTPLEKIAKGEAEEIFLKTQGLDFNYIPEKDEVVYLRENSNVSTGGDSIDYTDDVHISYKQIAEQASKALNVNITGLDMIIKDHTVPATADNHSIIEMNFNPAIHIHCYPFVGKNRYLNEKILDALGFEND